MSVLDDVRAFRRHVGLPSARMPSPITPDRARLNVCLGLEEFRETVQALGSDGLLVEILRVAEMVAKVDRFDQPQDLELVADGLADQVYIANGTADEMGLPLDDVHVAVHASNMTKCRDNVRGDGKILKGEAYRPPDIARVLINAKARAIGMEAGAAAVAAGYHRVPRYDGIEPPIESHPALPVSDEGWQALVRDAVAADAPIPYEVCAPVATPRYVVREASEMVEGQRCLATVNWGRDELEHQARRLGEGAYCHATLWAWGEWDGFTRPRSILHPRVAASRAIVDTHDQTVATVLGCDVRLSDIDDRDINPANRTIGIGDRVEATDPDGFVHVGTVRALDVVEVEFPGGRRAMDPAKVRRVG